MSQQQQCTTGSSMTSVTTTTITTTTTADDDDDDDDDAATTSITNDDAAATTTVTQQQQQQQLPTAYYKSTISETTITVIDAFELLQTKFQYIPTHRTSTTNTNTNDINDDDDDDDTTTIIEDDKSLRFDHSKSNSFNNNPTMDDRIQLSMELIHHVTAIVMTMKSVKEGEEAGEDDDEDTMHHRRRRHGRRYIHNTTDDIHCRRETMTMTTNDWEWNEYIKYMCIVCHPIPIVFGIRHILLSLIIPFTPQSQSSPPPPPHKTTFDSPTTTTHITTTNTTNILLQFIIHHLLPILLFPTTTVTAATNKTSHNQMNETETDDINQEQQQQQQIPNTNGMIDSNNNHFYSVWYNTTNCCCCHNNNNTNTNTNTPNGNTHLNCHCYNHFISIILSLPQLIRNIHTTTTINKNNNNNNNNNDPSSHILHQQHPPSKQLARWLQQLPKYIQNESMYYNLCMSSSFHATMLAVATSTTTTTTTAVQLPQKQLFCTLVRYLLRRNNGRYVAQGIYRLYHNRNNNNSYDDDDSQLPNNITSPPSHHFSQQLCQLLLPQPPPNHHHDHHHHGSNTNDATNSFPNINHHTMNSTNTNDCLSKTEIAILYRALLRYIIMVQQRERESDIAIIDNDKHSSHDDDHHHQKMQKNKKEDTFDDDRIIQSIMGIFHSSILQYYSHDICQYIVLSSSSLTALSSTSMNNNGKSSSNIHDYYNTTTKDLPSNRRLCHIFALHLCRTPLICRTSSSDCRENEDDDDDGDDDDDSVASERTNIMALEEEIPNRTTATGTTVLLLYLHLCHVATTWSHTTFLYETDIKLQQHITGFLLSGISMLIENRYIGDSSGHNKDNNNPGVVDDSSYIQHYTTLSMRLIEGVTHHMSSTNTLTRFDGMYVGQQLASLLGQPDLQFEELISSDICTNNIENATNSGSNGDGTIDKVGARDKHDNHDIVNDLDDDNDSDWDDDTAILEPYDIEDDRQDLRIVPQPLYLSECVDYLLSRNTEDNTCQRHETVLQDLSRLVRTRPADLIDYGPELARIIVRLEDKFNMTNFDALVSDSLCALVVEDPIAVGTNLIEELFEDGTFRDRLTILHALNEASYELSGNNNQLGNKKVFTVENILPLDISSNLPRIAGKREFMMQLNNETIDTKQDRTRRWGKGRHQVAEPKSIENRFSAIASTWFYLLTGRFVHCKDNTSLWGGEVGATLLTSLFLTLSHIVDFTGPYTPGVAVLAQDLLELVWPLRNANVANVRSSVLYAVSIALCYVPEQTIFTMIMDSSTDNLITNIQYICDNDTDSDCLELANHLKATITTTLHTINESCLLK